MRLYLELARVSFRQRLAYRGATLAGLFTNAVFGALLTGVMTGLYRSRPDGAGEVAGFGLAEALTFIWVGQSLITVVAIWGTWEVADSIQSGAVVNDLLRPFDFFAYWLSRDLGRAASQVLMRGLPTLAIGLLVYDLAGPPSAARWAVFALSVALATVACFAYRFMLNLSAFWLTDVRGVGVLSLLTLNFLSGFLVPIPFFPGWLRAVAEVLPFRAMVMTPIEVFLGHGSPVAALGLQAFWAVVLCLAARGLLDRAVRRLLVQGG